MLPAGLRVAVAPWLGCLAAGLPVHRAYVGVAIAGGVLDVLVQPHQVVLGELGGGGGVFLQVVSAFGARDGTCRRVSEFYHYSVVML